MWLEVLSTLIGISPLFIAWALAVWLINQFKYDENGYEIKRWWRQIRF